MSLLRDLNGHSFLSQLPVLTCWCPDQSYPDLWLTDLNWCSVCGGPILIIAVWLLESCSLLRHLPSGACANWCAHFLSFLPGNTSWQWILSIEAALRLLRRSHYPGRRSPLFRVEFYFLWIFRQKLLMKTFAIFALQKITKIPASFARFYRAPVFESMRTSLSGSSTVSWSTWTVALLADLMTRIRAQMFPHAACFLRHPHFAFFWVSESLKLSLTRRFL